MTWDTAIRVIICVLYLVVAYRAVVMVRSGRLRRWKERYVSHMIGAIATGWAIYWASNAVRFWDSVGSSHGIVTHAGRTLHVPTAVMLMTIQYLLRGRR